MERYFEDELCQMRMHEQGYTQSDMAEFDRKRSEKSTYVATPPERAYYRDPYKVVQPNQGGGSNTVKTEEHHEKIVQSTLRTWCRTVVIMDVVAFRQGLLGGILRRRNHGNNHHITYLI